MGLTRISATSVTDTDFKTSCKVATSTNIASFTTTPNSIDGYTFSIGDRVLVKAQDNPAENGIYVVESVGTGSNGRWSRAGDFRDAKGITNGAITFVERGIEANTFFFLGGLTSSVSVGSTALTFNSLVTETATTVIGSSQPNITSVGTLVTLDVTGNATVGNILANGFYFSNGSPFTVDSTQILNGNSNVKVAANGNVAFSVTGNSNVVVITDTGANISGTANITGNVNVGNIGGTTAVFTDLTGNLTTAAQPNITSVGTLVSLNVTGNANVGNLNTSGDMQIGGNDIRSSTGNVAITLNDQDVTVVGNLVVQGLRTEVGTQDLTINDSLINLHTQPNLAPLTADDGRDVGIVFHYYKTSDKQAFLGWANDSGFLEYYSDGTESAGVFSGTYGSLKIANVLATGGVFYNGTSNLTVANSGNVTISSAGTANVLIVTSTGANISGTANVTGNANVGNLGAGTVVATNLTGNLTTAAQPNITSVGTLTSLNVSGNANVGNLGTAQVLASANVTAPQLISNVATGTAPLVVTSTTRVSNLNVANSGYADTAGSATSATTAGTVTTAAQPNITSLGTLTSLGVSGTVTASTFTSNVATGTAPLTVTSTTRVSNLNVANAGYADTAGTATSATSATTAGTVTTAAQPNITSVGTLSALTVTGNATVGNILAGGFYYSNGSPFTVDSTQVVNGNSNVKVAANSNVTVSVAGNANIMTITGTGANISGTANVTGNITAGNVSAAGFYFANGTPYNRYTASSSAPSSPTNGDLWYDSLDNVLYVRIGDGAFSAWLDISSSTDVFANITANNANITDNLTVGANATVGNILAGGFYYSNGSPFTVDSTQIVNGNSNVKAAASANVTISVAGNANIVTVTGTGANISGTLNVSGNANAGNLGATTVIATDLTGNLTTAAQPNITSLGTLISLGVSGTVTASTFTSNVATGTAPLTVTSTTRVSNLNVANAGYADTAGTATSATSATTAGTVTTAAQPNITSVGTLSSLTVTGNVSAGNLVSGNITISSDTITSANATITIDPTTTGVGGTVIIAGNLQVTGTTTTIDSTTVVVNDLNMVLANNAATASAANGAGITINGAAASLTYNSTSNTWVFDRGLTVTGNATVTGILTDNYYYANGTPFTGGSGGGTFTASSTAPTSPSAGDHWYDTSSDILYIRVNDGVDPFWLDITSQTSTFANLSVTTAANIATINSGLMQNGNSNITITSNSNITFAVTGSNAYTMATSSFAPTGNGTQQLGLTGSRWSNIWGLASSAQYADLAEKYLADEPYNPGTVVIFGGDAEITVTTVEHDTRVAGVISTEPAYLMNDSEDKGNLWLPVALTGRVPCQVQGPVKKGDLIVSSSTPGVGRKMNKELYEPGCVIGKSLEDHTENIIKTIEVVVGRF